MGLAARDFQPGICSTLNDIRLQIFGVSNGPKVSFLKVSFLDSFGELVQAMALSSFLVKIFEGFQAALEMLGWLLGHLAVILTAWLVGVGSLELFGKPVFEDSLAPLKELVLCFKNH